MQEQNSLS